MEGLYEAKDNFGESNCNIDSENAIDLIWASNPMVWSKGNHLELFLGASDQSEGEEHDRGTVGGSGWSHGVNL